MALALLGVTPSASAYRPFDGTDADVAETGEFELELGPVHYLGARDGRYLLAPATVLNLGIVSGWELVVDAKNYLSLDSAASRASSAVPPRDSVRDADVLLKAILRHGSLQEGSGPSVAVEFGPLLPSLPYDGGFGASADFIVSQNFGFGAVHLNTMISLARDQHGELFEGVIVEGPHDLVVRPVAEVYVDRSWGPSTTTLSGLVGGIFTVKKALALDAGVRAARELGRPAVELRLGFTWALSAWDPAPPVRN